MDYLFILINSMAVFFGLSSMVLTGVVLNRFRYPILRKYTVLQLLLLVRQILYVFKVKNPLLPFTPQISDMLYCFDFILIAVSLIIISFILRDCLKISFLKFFLAPLCVVCLVYGYGSLSFIFSAIPHAFEILPNSLWLISGYGSLFYFSVLILARISFFKGKRIRRQFFIVGIAGCVFSLIMAIDDMYLFRDFWTYGFFSFPLFHFFWYLISIFILTGLFLHNNSLSNQKIEKRLKENYGMSPRETEIAVKVSEGASYKEIGEMLFISIGTVKTHIFNIYKKAGCTNKIELINIMKKH